MSKKGLLLWTIFALHVLATGVHAANLTHFPILINLSTDTDLSADARSDGFDILFTEDDGTTQLDHEIETYVSGTGALVAWVRIPSLSSTVDTQVYMYYGYASSPNQQNANGVWDANYEGVWHLNETVTDEQITAAAHNESTSNPNDGDQNGNDDIAGQIAKGQDFDGANDGITIADHQQSIRELARELGR
ncbi:MAG: DUF2341 domain-containing protein [Actinomycetia bacterium]|nr:DUF2341 domain-containing protein [Actinomycetes bacterium]